MSKIRANVSRPMSNPLTVTLPKPEPRSSDAHGRTMAIRKSNAAPANVMLAVESFERSKLTEVAGAPIGAAGASGGGA